MTKDRAFTCICTFGAGVTLLVPLTAPHLHKLSVQRVQDVPIHSVYCVGQLNK